MPGRRQIKNITGVYGNMRNIFETSLAELLMVFGLILSCSSVSYSQVGQNIPVEWPDDDEDDEDEQEVKLETASYIGRESCKPLTDGLAQKTGNDVVGVVLTGTPLTAKVKRVKEDDHHRFKFDHVRCKLSFEFSVAKNYALRFNEVFFTGVTRLAKGHSLEFDVTVWATNLARKDPKLLGRGKTVFIPKPEKDSFDIAIPLEDGEELEIRTQTKVVAQIDFTTRIEIDKSKDFEISTADLQSAEQGHVFSKISFSKQLLTN